MNACERGIDAGAYVLSALDDHEFESYSHHLEGCAACRAEVRQLQGVVDTLPMAAPQAAPPPELKSRLMATVTAEAELLRAAGADADRPEPARDRSPRRRWGWLPAFGPLTAAGFAAVLIGTGLVGGLALREDDAPAPRTEVVAGTSNLKGARVTLARTGDRAKLQVRGLPEAPEGRVYQVWFQTGDAPPQPSRTLFDVRREGRADVQIEEPVEGVDRVLVTAEPDGGSQKPSGAPILVAQTAS